ncbi:MAG: hypothetical protein A2005_09030 [Desulfuromonadales bacterium GWC2_61_20]|nr:MAG: hypothetical protein A2005_09030 [Desulfuromonadales bacterium GWC2_61_20]HAD04873.1 hypothetical protein [Desulfuromonas sp.]HBT83630.1 hypothetical protein [Desulfuromonas sp.]
MISRVFLYCGLLLLFAAPRAQAAQSRVFTLWPVLDYRSAPAADFSSFHLLGPLIKYESSSTTTRSAVRPFFFHESSAAEHTSTTDLLFPVATIDQGDNLKSFQFLRLLTFDFAARESGSKDEFMLFPLLFYNHLPGRDATFALFPLIGRIEGKYGRERIDFVLFPLYARTSTKELTTTNLPWPIFSWVEGEGVSGWQFWPLYGFTEKSGRYHKRFFLWPFFFRNDLSLAGDETLRETLVFPVWASIDSPSYQSQHLLWPFFGHTADRDAGYEEWDFPWPLLRLTRGERRNGVRILPFYTRERIDAYQKRWFLWPLYKIEERDSEILTYRRDRIAYFLYSDTEERLRGEDFPRKKRVALWPLFTYENKDGLARFSTPALLEPFFPENERIERNWAPFWRLYQVHWDRQGNEAASLLWNLYWKERRGEDLFWELFPLAHYRHEAAVGVDLALLKGLFRYRRSGERTKVTFLFLPWGPSWATPASNPLPPGALR